MLYETKLLNKIKIYIFVPSFRTLSPGFIELLCCVAILMNVLCILLLIKVTIVVTCYMIFLFGMWNCNIKHANYCLLSEGIKWSRGHWNRYHWNSVQKTGVVSINDINKTVKIFSTPLCIIHIEERCSYSKL